ncbi:hypothetical protein T492DRAFT_1104441 [Pavlovales sp. CCMP2436]|nr:hypothetical protein T492DRAFT_1104441 [Pavlovales sp. CCMP2436]
MRGVQRLLNRPDLPAETKAKQEASLAKLDEEMRKAKRGRLESHRSTKYHKVKFFERQKCDRRIKQAEKKLAAAADATEWAPLEAELAAHRLDLQYIRYYPPEHKYISLYPKEGGDDEFVVKRRLKLRELVAARIAKGKGRTDQDDDDESDAEGGEEVAEDDFFLSKD